MRKSEDIMGEGCTIELTPVQVNEAILAWLVSQGVIGQGDHEAAVLSPQTVEPNAPYIVSWMRGDRPDPKDSDAKAPTGDPIYKTDPLTQDEATALGAMALESTAFRFPIIGFDIQIVPQGVAPQPGQPPPAPAGTMQLACMVLVPPGLLDFQEHVGRLALPPHVVQQQVGQAFGKAFAMGEVRVVFYNDALKDEDDEAPKSRLVIS